MLTRKCSGCLVEKEYADFYLRKSGAPQSRCKVCTKEQSKQWRKKHPEKYMDSILTWQNENPAKKKLYEERYRATKHFRQLNNSYSRNRRARVRGNGGTFTAAEWLEILRLYGRCLDCGTKEGLVADHVIPISKGGRNEASNIQPLCQTCNLLKGVKDTDFRPKGQT